MARGVYQRKPIEASVVEEAAKARFWAHVHMGGPNECWLWTGVTSKGYGLMGAGGRKYRVHRFAYELLVGPIPDGLVLDHLCRVRNCVNPAHLEPVTDLENILRGERASKTHCIHGHEFTPENTSRNAAGHRDCLTCKRGRNARHRARRREGTRV